MTKPLIPVDLVIVLRSHWPRPTWNQVSKKLYAMGYPPKPYPPFHGKSLMDAVARLVKCAKS